MHFSISLQLGLPQFRSRFKNIRIHLHKLPHTLLEENWAWLSLAPQRAYKAKELSSKLFSTSNSGLDMTINSQQYGLQVSFKAQLASLIFQFFLLTRQCWPCSVSLNILNPQCNRIYCITITLLKQRNFKSRERATLCLKRSKVLDNVWQGKKKF